MPRGLDTACDTTPHVGELVKAGYSFVGRYYCDHTSIPTKLLTYKEAKHLSEMGLYVVSVYESRGDHPEYFTKEQGVKDAQMALLCAKNCHQPTSTPIYFAVDTDTSATQVHDYFVAVGGVLANTGYMVGVYGGGTLCQTLKDWKLVSHTWLAQSMGWNGSKTYKGANIVQGKSTTLFGMDVDLDTSDGFAGGWKING